MFDDQTELQTVPKLLLHVSIRELHNSLVSDQNDGGLKDAWDEDDNIIINDSTLSPLLPTQLKQMTLYCAGICFNCVGNSGLNV